MKQQQEIWKPVAGYEGRYEVSSFGRVCSVIRGRKILTPSLNNKGYLLVNLYTKGVGGKCLLVHRLVCIAFVGDPPTEDHEVNHKNGDRTDSRVVNLEWVTSSQNLKHSYDLLGRKAAFLGKTGREHPRSRPVIRSGGGLPDHGYESVHLTAADGFYPANVIAVCRGRLPRTGGFYWRYAEVAQ